MKDTWLTHNTDKLLLFLLIICFGSLILHILHHGSDANTLSWAENEFSGVVGAFILILTGRTNRADGQTGNGLPTPPVAPAPNPTEQK